jgi:hypothetical protein
MLVVYQRVCHPEVTSAFLHVQNLGIILGDAISCKSGIPTREDIDFDVVKARHNIIKLSRNYFLICVIHWGMVC